MNRREFIRNVGVVAGTAALGSVGCTRSTTKETNEETEKMKKSIVIYFSHTGENYSVGFITEGNTAKVAKEIAAQTGAEIWELKEKEPYPEKYTTCIELAKQELEAKARPEFVGEIPDLSEVGTIYLGYPNWWSAAPMIIYSFLDSGQIDGKTVLPFCTHEGSGLGSTARKLAAAYPKVKFELKGLDIFGHVAQNEPDEVRDAVAAWLKGDKNK